MPNANPRARRAQETCAYYSPPPELPRRIELLTLPPDVLAEIDAAASLTARLRAFLGAFSRSNPCRLSAAELATIFCPASKPWHGERSIRRALAELRCTYRDRLIEHEQWAGELVRFPIATTRWIESASSCQGGGAHSGIPDQVDPARGSRSGRSTRARARELPSRSPPPPRRRAERLVLPPLPRELVSHEEGPLAAIARVHGDEWAAELAADLRARAAYRGRAEEVDRALRTLAERRTPNPLRLFRDLFNRACRGDMLCDARAEAARATAAIEEAAAANPWRYDPDDPSTHWADSGIELETRPPPPTPAELAAAAEHARRLRALDPPSTRSRGDPAAAARFLALLASRSATDRDPDTS